jgi:hypothetical protein
MSDNDNQAKLISWEIVEIVGCNSFSQSPKPVFCSKKDLITSGFHHGNFSFHMISGEHEHINLFLLRGRLPTDELVKVRASGNGKADDNHRNIQQPQHDIPHEQLVPCHR